MGQRNEESEELKIGEVKATKIVEEFGTPLYAYDKEKIRSQYSKLSSALKSNTANFSVSYAVKANPNPEIVRTLVEEGAGLDCASEAELKLALELVEPEKIIYTAPFPPKEELNYAVEKGVTVNLDAKYLLEELEETPERLSFRIDPGIGKGDFGLVLGGGSKFGIPEEEAAEAYQAAVEKGVKRFGIHMMTGSGILDPEYFGQITEKILEIADRISRETGIEFEFVDIGGGLGVPYKPGQEPLDIEKTAEIVVEKFEEGVEEKDIGAPELKMEPGRFLVAESGYLLTRVNGVKEKDGKTFVGVDTGMHQFLRPMLYDAYHEIEAVNPSSEKITADIVGLVCENTDTLAEDREISRVAKGDSLVVKDVGAYGFAMASNWNTRPLPSEVMVEDGEVSVIREGQSWRDVFHGTGFP